MATKSTPDGVDLKLSNYSTTAAMNGSIASANNATLAVVGNLQLAPARPVLRQEEIVQEVGGVGHDKRVKAKSSPRLSQSSGPAEAAPAIGQRGARKRPGGREACRRCCARAVNVAVDTSPTVVKFPALAVLLMVNVLPVIPVAKLSRSTLAAPVMLSELPDTAPVNNSVAPATVRWLCAAQETAPKASTPVVNTSVQLTSLHSAGCSPRCPAQ